MLAEPFTGDDPFVVVFPDDLHVCEPPLTHQLIDTYERTCCSVLAVEHDPPHLERYGVVALAADGCTSPALWRSRPRAPSRAATSPSGGTCIRPRSTVRCATAGSATRAVSSTTPRGWRTWRGRAGS